MATRAATVSYTPDGLIVTWTGLLNTDDGAPVDLSRYTSWTAQITGTFGTGGEGRIEGRNVDSAAFGVLRMFTSTGHGDAIFTTSQPGQLLGHTLEARPRISAGDATTDLTCVIVAIR